MSSPKPLVLLTGVNGFVGVHVLDALLKSNYRVRGIVRSLSKSQYLNSKYSEASRNGDLTFEVVPDIQAPRTLDHAMDEVEYICHVASPYFTDAKDPIKELIEPAVNGTKNIMSSAVGAKSLKRLTVVSSFASVIDLSKNPRAGYVYTDKDWDPLTYEEASKNGVLGYHASKTFAEKAAWDMWKEARSQGKISWDLITFCPPMIYGPPIHELDISKGVEGLNTSLKRLVTSIQGKDPVFAPKVGTPGLPAWVDVRDVAQAHTRALKLDSGVSERILLCGGINYFEDGIAGLRSKNEQSLGEEGARCDKSKHFSLDRSKAMQVLGLDFTPFQKTVEDSWEGVKTRGIL